jgi:hypothetical protein
MKQPTTLIEGNRYTHIETGKPYTLLNLCQMKHPEKDVWLPAVIYMNEDKFELFTCSAVRFINRFEHR